jgi:hypothetical protein
VPISIKKIDGLYSADVTPPHGGGETWSTTEPLERDQLVQALRELGCHQTDIGDAFYAGDPNWVG